MKGITEMLKQFSTFFSEAKAELKKVSWPTRKEIIDSTIVVIVSVIIMAVFIGSVDFVLARMVQFIIR
jgi:preprotein translocase subunit SecE